MKIKYFARAWKEDLSKLAETQKFWDLRADDFNQHHSADHDKKRYQQVIEFLTNRNILNADAQILDIGCGPGVYTIEFAKKTRYVTGIDISCKMLEYAREKAIEQKLDNIVFELSPWETLQPEEWGWQKKYDLVFASMCPGISSADSLLKMCRVSKGACFLSGFVDRKDNLRNSLYQEVYGQEPEDFWGKNIYYAINLLWLSGYYPEVTYYDHEFNYVWTLDKAVELYTHQLKYMAKSKPQTEEANLADIEKKVAAYLSTIAVDGTVSEKAASKIAWLCWKV